MLPLHCDIQTFIEYAVAPYVGAWIETRYTLIVPLSVVSHPTWVRGMKPYPPSLPHQPLQVAPYVGAWIETFIAPISVLKVRVAPYVGAWIETLLTPRVLQIL